MAVTGRGSPRRTARRAAGRCRRHRGPGDIHSHRWGRGAAARTPGRVYPQLTSQELPARRSCGAPFRRRETRQHRTGRGSRAARSPGHRHEPRGGLGGHWGRLRPPEPPAPPDIAPGRDRSAPATRGTGKGQPRPRGTWGTAMRPPGGGGGGALRAPRHLPGQGPEEPLRITY